MSSNTKHETTKSDAQRIQSTQAKSGADTSAGSFAFRTQSAGDKNAAAAAGAQNATKSSDAKGGAGGNAGGK